MTPGEREDKTGGERTGKEKGASKETAQQAADRRFKRAYMTTLHIASTAMWPYPPSAPLPVPP
ncbi:hypothetical protein BDZ89DRAFT_1062967, partial [Hymenopellis radicata]